MGAPTENRSAIGLASAHCIGLRRRPGEPPGCSAIADHGPDGLQMAKPVRRFPAGGVDQRTAPRRTAKDHRSRGGSSNHPYFGSHSGATTHWSTRSMAKAVGLSQSAISRIWRAFSLQPHRLETFKLSSDPFFIEKVRDIAGLIQIHRNERWCCAWMRRAKFKL